MKRFDEETMNNIENNFLMGISAEQTAEELGISKSAVYRYYHDFRKKSLPVKYKAAQGALLAEQPARITISVPAEIKLTNGDNRVIGTIHVTTNGLVYRQANAKNFPRKYLTWETLNKLMELGL